MIEWEGGSTKAWAPSYQGVGSARRDCLDGLMMLASTRQCYGGLKSPMVVPLMLFQKPKPLKGTM